MIWRWKKRRGMGMRGVDQLNGWSKLGVGGHHRSSQQRQTCLVFLVVLNGHRGAEGKAHLRRQPPQERADKTEGGAVDGGG
jgi:hypothetical protein